MDLEDHNRSFSSLVETQTLDDILSPIADKVSTLLSLLKVRNGVPFPDLYTPARKLDVAVKEMIDIAKSVIAESPSEELQANMSMACNLLLPAAQELVEAARQLGRRPTTETQSWLGSAAHGVFEGTLKVLLVWDDGEVYKIVSACYDVLDKLALVQGAKSMRSLAVCFRGFSEAVNSLFHLVELRRKVLTVPQKKSKIQVAWRDFQACIPKLSMTMQNFVKNQDNIEAKRNRDVDVENTSNSIYNLIRAVEKGPNLDENDLFHDTMQQKAGSDTDEEEQNNQEVDDKDDEASLLASGIPKNMSGSILKVQHYLQSSSPYFIFPKFDEHIDAILHNSMAVASMSNDAYKQPITKLCDQVRSLRAQLHKCLARIRANPDSEEDKAAFDDTAQLICERLRELDRWVALAVVNEVTETFGAADDPIENLVEAATAPLRTPKTKYAPAGGDSALSALPDSDKGLNHHVEIFTTHSKRLSQVAQAAAQSTADPWRGEKIESLAAELERLTALVVQAALDVRNDPSNRECKERLHSLRREWARAVRELTTALDEVINPEEFIALSINHISHDLEKCRVAMEAGDRLELAARVQMIAAKAERVAEAVMAEVQEHPCSEEYKTNLMGKVTHLKKSVATMKSHASRYLDDPSSQEPFEAFMHTAKEVLDIIKQIEAALQEVIVEEVFSHTSLHEYQSPSTASALSRSVPTPSHATETTSPRGKDVTPLRTRTLPKPHHLGATGTLKPMPQPRKHHVRTEESGTQTLPLKTGGSEVNSPHYVASRTPGASGHTAPDLTADSAYWSAHKPGAADRTHHEAGSYVSDYTSRVTGQTPGIAGHKSHVTGQTHVTDHTPHVTAQTPHVTAQTPHVTSQNRHVTTQTPHVTTQTPHVTTQTPHVTTQTPHVTTQTPHVTAQTPRVTSQTPHVTGQTLDVADQASHVASHVTEFSPHSPETTDKTRHMVEHAAHLTDHTTQTPPPVARKRASKKTTGDSTDPNEPSAAGIQTYSSPLQGLVSAAKAGASTQIPDCATILSERANRLVQIARTVATEATSTPELSRALKMKANEVVRLTPSLIRHAEKIARDPRAMKELEELEADISQWAGHVRYLIDATQKANLPWSKTADKLVIAAKTGEGLQTQIKHVSTQTEKMIEIALASVQAVEREEAIGCTSDTSILTQDPQVQAELEHVQNTVEEIRKLTPELIKAAEDAAQIGSVEPLRLVAYEWATKAKTLMKGVDNLSLGMGGPADALIISAGTQDPTLLEEHAKNVKGVACALQTVAMDSVAGCPDPAQAQEIQVTAKNIEKVSNQLAECASELMRIEEEDEDPDTKQATEEKKELLCRDWATQVHLLTAHVDELTAHVTTPLDALVSIALEASKTELAKEHLMSQFKAKARRLRKQLDQLRETFDKTVKSKAERQQAVDNADRAIAFLIKLSPHVVNAARALSNEPASPLLDHYHHLRRQWASKAHYLETNLKMISGVDLHPVLEAFDQLIHGTLSPLNTSAEDAPISPVTKAYSTENIHEGLTSYDPKNMSSKVPNAPHTGPLKKKLSADFARPQLGEVVLKLPHRVSKGALPETSGEQASNSILVAAQSLRDTTDRYEEEGNAIVAMANELSQLTAQLAAFAKGTAERESREDMTDLASAIVTKCQKMAEFAHLVSEQCADQMIKDNLQACAMKIPTLTTQLKILASVKASTPDDLSAGVMLVKNIQNLTQAVTNIIHAAQAASVKGLQHVPDSEATAFALNWKQKLYNQRTMEAIVAPTGSRGLRKLSKQQHRNSLQSVINSDPPKTYESQ